jgi:hypothetical protein
MGVRKVWETAVEEAEVVVKPVLVLLVELL